MLVNKTKTLSQGKERELGSKTAQEGQHHRDHLVFWKYLLNRMLIFFIDTGFHMHKAFDNQPPKTFLNFSFTQLMCTAKIHSP